MMEYSLRKCQGENTPFVIGKNIQLFYNYTT
jgi:hypothetical protein